MLTEEPILHVKADERGRVAIGKAIEALNGLLSSHVTGFDVSINPDASLVMRPTVEVPASCAMRLNQQDWSAFMAAMDKPPKPTTGLRKLAAETAQDRVRRT